VQGTMQRSDLPLLTIAREGLNRGGDLAIRQARQREAWGRAQGPWDVAIAQAKPGARIEQWIEWDIISGENAAAQNGESPDAAASEDDPAATQPAGPPKLRTPYLVRQVYGMGSVTWVAQDLGAPNLPGREAGW